MNKKVFLRGIGAGMVITAVVMGAFGKSQAKPLTDSEIIEKAKLLGMVESTVLSNIKDIPSASGDETNTDETKPSTDDISENDVNTDVVDTDKTDADTTNTDADTTDVDTNDENKTDDEDATVGKTDLGREINPLPEDNPGYEDNGDTVTITIIKGDSTISVSRRIYEAGLVDSAVSLDDYLCKNGYEMRVAVGTFEIPVGADYETIAKIITRSN